MVYLKKILKVLTLSLVISVLLFSIVSVNAQTAFFDIAYSPTQSVVPTAQPYVSPPPSDVTPPPDDSSSLVNFADSHLRNAIADELGVSSDDLRVNYLRSITGTLDLSDSDISELKGIEYLTSLDGLILSNNPITSRHEVKRLNALTGLEYLDISALSVTVIPSEIGSLTNLKYLDISANRIDTLPSALTDLSLDVLVCNYCFFDIADQSFISALQSTAASADYQYQLNKVDFYPICQTEGTVKLVWEPLENIVFPNGVVAEVKRISICNPNPNGSQGSWLDSISASKTSYTFEGLDSGHTYSFDISADYYIKNTRFDGKYIKFYAKELFKPIPQDTPTPKPTETPVPTDTPVITDTPAPTVPATVEPTDAPANIITINPQQNTAIPNQQANNGPSTSVLSILLVLVIILIVAIIILTIILVIRMGRQGREGDGQGQPRR